MESEPKAYIWNQQNWDKKEAIKRNDQQKEGNCH